MTPQNIEGAPAPGAPNESADTTANTEHDSGLVPIGSALHTHLERSRTKREARRSAVRAISPEADRTVDEIEAAGGTLEHHGNRVWIDGLAENVAVDLLARLEAEGVPVDRPTTPPVESALPTEAPAERTFGSSEIVRQFLHRVHAADGVTFSRYRVAAELVTYRNHRTGLAWPAVDRLAEGARVGHRTVQRALQWLVEAELVVVAVPATSKMPTKYLIPSGVSSLCGTPKPSRGVI